MLVWPFPWKWKPVKTRRKCATFHHQQQLTSPLRMSHRKSCKRSRPDGCKSEASHFWKLPKSIPFFFFFLVKSQEQECHAVFPHTQTLLGRALQVRIWTANPFLLCFPIRPRELCHPQTVNLWTISPPTCSCCYHEKELLAIRLTRRRNTERQKDILCCYIPPVNALIVVGPSPV